MFAGLSLLSLVVLMACGEEETKRLKQHNSQNNKRLYNKLLLEKMLQTSHCNPWMAKKLSYLILRVKGLLEVLGFMVWSMQEKYARVDGTSGETRS